LQAAQFIERSKDVEAWRKHARALRRSAQILWQEFERSLLFAVQAGSSKGTEPNLDEALETFETTKLLYGLALETALKAWIIEHKPSEIEIKVTMDGNGEAKQAELKNIGVPSSQGHNLLALAEVAGLFTSTFASTLITDSDRDTMRSICRDLGEVVVWRGRYPVPLASFAPLKLNPNVTKKALAHYLRDWLDPVLDTLLKDK